MTALAVFVSMAMAVLAPQRDTTDLAMAITTVVESEPPLFAHDESRVKTASLVVAVAFRESSFRNDAVGDHGRARCAFQLWDTSDEVLSDPEMCTRIAMSRLRESLQACGPRNMLGIYAAGPRGCVSEHAKRISADRLWLARRIAGERSALLLRRRTAR